ncbi:hypothetical protein PoB_002397500 [Plakobranchus ocellatus]|uniref:G-protein coupled receptors family 1 profile domain-containing protein n=1 Tax=Plakobranchus ocellatus TaxID=259542 RepID=A0AAV3ZQQ9_9GAST|nr:hypothetical protein PoB_002397500 [Plakobranchus ocellatus]
MVSSHDSFTNSLNNQFSGYFDPEHTLRVRLTLLVSAGGLLGLVGNGLLLSYYGNRQTRTYRSRDAIYIRRMAYTDFLICVLIIPYAVFFEAE